MLTQPSRRYKPKGFFSGVFGESMKPPLPELQVKIAPERDAVLVTLVGEAHFDFDVAGQYLQKIMKHKPKAVIIDAEGLTFLASVGMCFLINLRRELKAAGAPLKIAALQPLVENALQKAHLHGLFDCHKDVAAARGQPPTGR